MERENRKVLISVKVSTLLLILIAIIVGVVLINKVKSYIQNNAELANNTNYEQVENIEEVQTNRDIKIDVSSRGTNAEEKRHSDVEESKESEEIILNSNQETQETPKILYGAVGSINFDSAVIENSIEEDKIQEEPIIETTPIEEVTISKDMDLTVTTGLSREDFITLIAGVKEDKSGFFEENAGLIYDICQENQINEIFFCGLIAGESGWNIADNHRRTYNYISLMSGGRLIRYSSVEDGLRKAAETLHNNYLTEGGRFYYGKTLAAVKTKFCPSSTTWVNLIYGNMERILK